MIARFSGSSASACAPTRPCSLRRLKVVLWLPWGIATLSTFASLQTTLPLRFPFCIKAQRSSKITGLVSPRSLLPMSYLSKLIVEYNLAVAAPMLCKAVDDPASKHSVKLQLKAAEASCSPSAQFQVLLKPPNGQEDPCCQYHYHYQHIIFVQALLHEVSQVRGAHWYQCLLN